MNDEVRDNLVEDMLSIPPLCHRITRRRLLKATAKINVDISLPHFLIMKVTEDENMHIAEIGERLLIPRPQMTHMIDKLEELGLVTREADPEDRRTINVLLTDHGKSVLEEFETAVKSSIKVDLSCLNSREIQELSISLRNLRDILSKLQ